MLAQQRPQLYQIYHTKVSPQNALAQTFAPIALTHDSKRQNCTVLTWLRISTARLLLGARKKEGVRRPERKSPEFCKSCRAQQRFQRLQRYVSRNELKLQLKNDTVLHSQRAPIVTRKCLKSCTGAAFECARRAKLANTQKR
jgi:hypothetical protein